MEKARTVDGLEVKDIFNKEELESLKDFFQQHMVNEENYNEAIEYVDFLLAELT